MPETELKKFVAKVDNLAKLASWIKGAVIALVMSSFGAGVWATKIYTQATDAVDQLREMKTSQNERIKDWTAWRAKTDAVLAGHEVAIARNTTYIDRLR